MGKNRVGEKIEYIQGPAGNDDPVTTTVVAFHPSLIKALSRVDNGKARGNLPFILEGTIQEEQGVVAVTLSQDPNVLKAIRKLREDRMTNKGVDR